MHDDRDRMGCGRAELRQPDARRGGSRPGRRRRVSSPATVPSVPSASVPAASLAATEVVPSFARTAAPVPAVAPAPPKPGSACESDSRKVGGSTSTPSAARSGLSSSWSRLRLRKISDSTAAPETPSADATSAYESP
jgi:hypothetical protein